MATSNIPLSNFAAGKLSKRLRGRFDLPVYYNGVENSLNFIFETQGAARYRNGTMYLGETEGNNTARLFEFKFNDNQSYMLEFTDTSIRFITRDPTSGKVEFVISAPDTPLIVASPYLEAEIFELQFAQNADTMFITHPNHKPRELKRTGAATFTLTEFVPVADPFLVAGDYPRTVTFYEQRLWFGGTDNAPQKLYGSKAGDYFDFTTGVQADDGFVFTISGNEVSIIHWMAGMSNSLVVGTLSGNFSVTGGGTSTPITPTNINIKSTDYEGTSYQMPVYKDNLILYVQQGGIILRSYQFDFLSENFTSSDLNIIADDVTVSGIIQAVYQKGRPEIIWTVKNNGELAAMTSNSTENIFGWHEHKTDGKFTSISTLSESNGRDTLFTIVNRTINGINKYYVEYLTEPVQFSELIDFYTSGDDEVVNINTYLNKIFEEQKEYVHVDSALSYIGTELGSNAGATMNISASTGSGVTFTASDPVFDISMINREIWRKSVTGFETGRAKIVDFVSATEVVCNVTVDFLESDVTTPIPSGEWYLTASELSGLEHLEAKVVTVVTDGGNAGTFTVTGGLIDIGEQASVIHAGLKYIGSFNSMNMEVGGVIGVSQTKPKNVYQVGIRFADTLGASYGTDLYRMQRVEFRGIDSKIDRPPPPLSGDVRLSYNDATKIEKKLYILQDTPAPCNVQLMIPYCNTSDR